MNILRHPAPLGLLLIACGAVATALLSTEAAAPSASVAARGAPRAIAPARSISPAVQVAHSSTTVRSAQTAPAVTHASTDPASHAEAASSEAPTQVANPTAEPARVNTVVASSRFARQAPAAEARAIKRAVARLERQRQVERKVSKLRRMIGFSVDDPVTDDLELLLTPEPSPFSDNASNEFEDLFGEDLTADY